MTTPVDRRGFLRLFGLAAGGAGLLAVAPPALVLGAAGGAVAAAGGISELVVRGKRNVVTGVHLEGTRLVVEGEEMVITNSTILNAPPDEGATVVRLTDGRIRVGGSGR